VCIDVCIDVYVCAFTDKTQGMGAMTSLYNAQNNSLYNTQNSVISGIKSKPKEAKYSETNKSANGSGQTHAGSLKTYNILGLIRVIAVIYVCDLLILLYAALHTLSEE
jgi:hypothetical protein